MLPAGPLQPIDVPANLFFRIGLYLLGPFPLSISEKKWITVTTTYYVTHYTTARALPTSCATDVADLLKDIILHHGTPRQLLRDCGRYFLSKVVEDILCSCSIQHKLTTGLPPTDQCYYRATQQNPHLYAFYTCLRRPS